MTSAAVDMYSQSLLLPIITPTIGASADAIASRLQKLFVSSIESEG